ncbi:hypothetical protein Scep_001861 [Stephania cephalantha]|uniref:Uncharacterized protein n=1 Tax=Stephania cephalantha TaxID=152367 RepID=A0AAP0L9W7_9MAGN
MGNPTVIVGDSQIRSSTKAPKTAKTTEVPRTATMTTQIRSSAETEISKTQATTPSAAPKSTDSVWSCHEPVPIGEA